jgi:hypothetical protein
VPAPQMAAVFRDREVDPRGEVDRHERHNVGDRADGRWRQTGAPPGGGPASRRTARCGLGRARRAPGSARNRVTSILQRGVISILRLQTAGAERAYGKSLAVLILLYRIKSGLHRMRQLWQWNGWKVADRSCLNHCRRSLRATRISSCQS